MGGYAVSKDLLNPVIFYRNTVFADEVEDYLRDECGVKLCVQSNVDGSYDERIGGHKVALEDQNGKIYRGKLGIKLYALKQKVKR